MGHGGAGSGPENSNTKAHTEMSGDTGGPVSGSAVIPAAVAAAASVVAFARPL